MLGQQFSAPVHLEPRSAQPCRLHRILRMQHHEVGMATRRYAAAIQVQDARGGRRERAERKRLAVAS